MTQTIDKCIGLTSISATRWKLMEQIKDIAFQSDAYLFGGAVRDYHIHNHYARKFYDSCSTPMESKKYGDLTYKPEFIGRLCLPNDLDFYMNTNKVDSFLQGLEDRYLQTFNINDPESNKYKKNLPLDVYHIKLSVRFKTNSILANILPSHKLSVNIDIIHTKNISLYQPPFGKIDVECNCLMISPKKEYVVSSSIIAANAPPEDKIEKLTAILKDITNKETHIVDRDCDPYRLIRMLNKGWKINASYVIFFKTPISELTDDKSEERCIICLDNMIDKTIQVKFTCCNARWHRECLQKYLSNYDKSKLPKCPQCSKFTNITPLDKVMINSNI